MSEELRTVLRDMGAAGYRAGYEAAADRMPVDPFQSARVFFPPGTGKDAAFVLEEAHGSAYLRGMHDQQRGLDPGPERTRRIRPGGGDPAGRTGAGMTVLQKAGAAGYGRGYDDAAAGAGKPRPIEPGTRDGPGTGGRGAESSRRRDGQGLPAGLRRPHARGQSCRRRLSGGIR